MSHNSNKAPKPMGPGFSSKFEEQAATRKHLFYTLVTFIALVVGVSVIGNVFDKRPAVTSHPANIQQNTSTTLPDSYKDVLATMINLKGELCAKVTDVSRLQKDIYQVDCIRYRDGTGTASYEVNARTGAVK